MHKFNHLIKNRKAKMFNFPGASSHQLLHYLDVYLKNKSIDTVIIHTRINDLLTNSCRSGMDNLIYNIKNITEKCLVFGAMSVFISGLVYTTRVDVSLLERIHVLIFDFCRKNSFIYIGNRNIRSDSLYKDGLHLIDTGRAFLTDNFIVYLNNNTFLETHTHHPPKKILGKDFRQIAELFQVGAELHLLQKDRKQYLNNLLIDYLNVNSVRNKIADLQTFIQNIPLDYLVLSETKLDESFPNAQFNLDGYEIIVR